MFIFTSAVLPIPAEVQYSQSYSVPMTLRQTETATVLGLRNIPGGVLPVIGIPLKSGCAGSSPPAETKASMPGSKITEEYGQTLPKIRLL